MIPMANACAASSPSDLRSARSDRRFVTVTSYLYPAPIIKLPTEFAYQVCGVLCII